MTKFNYSLKKWFRTVSFSMLLVAGCFLNNTAFAQNREAVPQSNNDQVTGVNPFDLYIANNKTNSMVMYYLQNPGNSEIASIIKMKSVIENPSAAGYSPADLDRMKSSLKQMQVKYLETILKSPQTNNQPDQKLTGEQAALAARQQAEQKKALIKALDYEINHTAPAQKNAGNSNLASPALLKAQ